MILTKRMHMTRLMCSKDREEVEALKRKLFRAGIRSEIRSNPIASGLGITRLEVFIDERDFLRASKVRQELGTVVSADNAAGRPGTAGRNNGFVKGGESEAVTEAEVLPFPSFESAQVESLGRGATTVGTEPETEFAQATALLEKEVEELLARETKLIDRCSSLEEEAKTLKESLTQTRTDLAREVSDRASMGQKLAEACEARASLEKEMEKLQTRFKASDQALEASQAKLESQTRELGERQARIASLEKDAFTRDAQLEKNKVSLTEARAEMEQEKDLRLAAEQKSTDLEAALKSLECQVTQHAQRHEQLLSERKNEHDKMRACVGMVNDLRSRVRAKLVAREQQ